MTEHVYRRFGDTDFPPDLTARPATLFASLDPQLDQMLALFKTALIAELGAAWDLAKQGTALSATSPVEDTLWAQPTKGALRSESLKYPLLCLARVSGKHEALTLVKDQVRTTWALDYLLGPLTAADQRRLIGALQAASKVIQTAIWDHSHPAFENGAAQFAGINEIGVTSSAMGPASFGEDGEGVEYWGLHLDLETSETDKALPGSVAPYQGASFIFGIGDGQEILRDAIIARTDVPLTSP